MASARVNGINLVYEIVGEGEPMMLLGGAGLAKENFDPIIEHLVPHFQLLIPDLRGYGASDRTGIENVTIDLWADDAIALLDAVGWERAHVHGTSVGGNIALSCGIRYPERCTSLIVHGCVAKSDVAHSLLFEACIEHSRLAGKMDRTLACMIAEGFVSHEFLDENPNAVDEAVLPRLEGVPLETWLAAFTAMKDANQAPGLPGCQVPTLVLTGEHARHFLDLAPSGVGLRKMAELLPNGRLVLLEGAGHLVIFERPEEYSEHVVSFTRSLAGP